MAMGEDAQPLDGRNRGRAVPLVGARRMASELVAAVASGIDDS